MNEQNEKQAIEEMAYSVCRLENKPENCASCMWKASCENYLSAENYYAAGYRKQSEGEWIEQVRVSKEGKPLLRHYKCNLCGVYLATQTNFCPNCGSRMKGGAE